MSSDRCLHKAVYKGRPSETVMAPKVNTLECSEREHFEFVMPAVAEVGKSLAEVSVDDEQPPDGDAD